MKLTKKEVMEQNRKLKRDCWIVTVLSLMIVMFAVGIFYNSTMNKSNPTFEIKKEILDDKTIDGKKWNLGGSYAVHQNHIELSLKDPDPLTAIYHEYGHYIYFKLMTKEERLEWGLMCDLRNIEVRGYKENSWCLEWFAIQFAKHLEGYWIDESKFISEMVEKYLK